MLGLSQRSSQKQTQRLSQITKQQLKEALELKETLLQELIQQLKLEKYETEGRCPKCHYELTVEEILNGFSDSETDIRTTCPKCEKKFIAELVCSSYGSKTRVQFLCPKQTLYELKKIGIKKPSLIKRNARVFRSALFHFGKLKNAFAKIDIKYPYREIHTWQAKVTPFLGKLPDTQIAKAAHVADYKVRYLRNKLGIERFTNEKLYQKYLVK